MYVSPLRFNLLGPTMLARSNAPLLHATPNVGEGSRQSNAGGHKPWLMRLAIRSGKRGVHVDGL